MVPSIQMTRSDELNVSTRYFGVISNFALSSYQYLEINIAMTNISKISIMLYSLNVVHCDFNLNFTTTFWLFIMNLDFLNNDV